MSSSSAGQSYMDHGGEEGTLLPDVATKEAMLSLDEESRQRQQQLMMNDEFLQQCSWGADGGSNMLQ